MVRAKRKMELITKEKTRNTTYQNRKHSIIKKAKELSVLCDVDTSMIIFPLDSNHPEIWPENPDQIKNMITSYRENGKRTSDVTDYFEARKRKIEDELTRARKRNMEAKYATWFDELNGLSEGQLRQFSIGLENKEKAVRDHIELKKRNFNLQMPFGFELENSQPCNNNNVVHQDLVSHDLGGFRDAPNLELTLGLGLGNNQPANQDVGSSPSLDQVQVLNHEQVSQDLGCFNGASTSSFIPLKPEMGGFGSPVFEGGVVHDNSNP